MLMGKTLMAQALMVQALMVQVLRGQTKLRQAVQRETWRASCAGGMVSGLGYTTEGASNAGHRT
ncbi:MAG: hypothetical protein ACKOBM_10045, partial [Gammaproteobacteria bacterium]